MKSKRISKWFSGYGTRVGRPQGQGAFKKREKRKNAPSYSQPGIKATP